MTGVPFLDLAAENAPLSSELEAAAQRVLRSGRYLSGGEAEQFEDEFARYCGLAGAVGVANGLEALELTLAALGIGAGDEVLVSAHTAIATFLAVTHAGARPVPIDAATDTMLLDPALVEAAIGPRTAAIVPVHLYGLSADMDQLVRIADKHGLALLEDASQAHGARWRDRPVGSFGRAGAFSLYPTKNLGAFGDAGIVVSDDADLLARVRTLANYGGSGHNRSQVIGYNSRLDELQAALLRVKLGSLDEANARRRDRAAQYLDALAGREGVTLPVAARESVPVWHQFAVRVAERDRVRDQLSRSGIGTLVHYPVPPHRSGAYADEYPDPIPVTEQIAESVLSLPISPGLSESACARVCEALSELCVR